jgi:hypothetical protein
MQFTIVLGMRGRNIEKCSVFVTVLHLYVKLCKPEKKDKSQCVHRTLIISPEVKAKL